MCFVFTLKTLKKNMSLGRISVSARFRVMGRFIGVFGGHELT
jgi:hypothetical protein